MHRPKPTSAENGRRSRGPITEAGREKARQAALEHGLCARKLVLLPTESQEMFNENHESFVNKFQPADDVEANCVVDIAAANWRLGRAHAMEKALFTMNTQEDAYTETGADRYLPVLDNARLNTLQVYISRIERSYQRSLNNLIKIRRYFGSEEEIVEPELEIDPAEIEIPPPVEEISQRSPAEGDITPQPEPAPEPQSSQNPPQPAPQAAKRPPQRQKTIDQDSVAPAVQPDDPPKAA